MGTYSHIRQPEIEQYANALTWEEGTLEEEITSEELLEREARNIQKETDLETYGQVPLSYKRQLGATSSASSTHQPAAMNPPQTTNKGKEKQVEQPPPMTEEQMETLVQQQEEMEK